MANNITSPLNTPPHQQISPLTSIRAIAILCISALHYRGIMEPVDLDYLNTLLRWAFVGLNLFFILSGFILCYVYNSAFVVDKPFGKSLKRFYISRFMRVHPLHIIVMSSMVILAFVGITTLYEHDTALNFFGHFFLIHGFGIDIPHGWNPPSWSVGTELLFYIFFPFLAFLTQKVTSSFIISVATITLCTLLYHYTDTRMLYLPHPELHKWIIDVPCALMNCLLGMLLAKLYLNRFLSHLDLDYIMFLTCILWILAFAYQGSEATMFIFFPLLSLGLRYVKGFFYHLLSWKPLVRAGEASYSLYLWHTPYMIVFLTFAYRMGFTNEQGDLSWYSLLFAFPLLIILSISSHDAIEQPFRLITKRYINRRS